MPRAALGAALALVALAAAPVLVGRDVLRLGLGLLLLLAAAGLLRNVMAVGTDGPVELALAVLTAFAGAAVAAVVARALLVQGDLELRPTTRDIGGWRHGDDAHPRPWPGMYGPYGPRRRALPPTPGAHRDLRRSAAPRPRPTRAARSARAARAATAPAGRGRTDGAAPPARDRGVRGHGLGRRAVPRRSRGPRPARCSAACRCSAWSPCRSR